MKFNNIDVCRFEARLSIYSISGSFGHVATNQRNRRLVERGLKVSFETDSFDLNCLTLQAVLDYEFFATNNRSSCTITCWAALQLSEWVVDFLRFHYLVERVYVSKLTIRIVSAVAMVLFGDLREVFQFGAILFHMFFTRISKQLRRHRRLRRSSQFLVLGRKLLQRVRSVIEERLKRPCEHLLESKS